MKNLKKIIGVLLFPIFANCSVGELRKETASETIELCSKAPNCVVSLESEKKNAHYIEPISMGNYTVQEMHDELMNGVEKLGGKVVAGSELYIKAEFISKIFKFKDIAEFHIEPEKREVIVRSAAQSGWYDFGVNRRRIEQLKKIL